MPVERTPPPSLHDVDVLADSAAIAATKFSPPSGLLASVTRKGNEISKLMNEDPSNKEEIKSEFEVYEDRILKLKEACESQINLDEPEETKKREWWNAHNPSIVTLQIAIRKHLQELTGARPKRTSAKSIRSHHSSHTGSICTSASIARIRLVEKTAKMKAEIKFNETLKNIEKEEMELKAIAMKKRREAEIQKLEMEKTVLETELRKLDEAEGEIDRILRVQPDNPEGNRMESFAARIENTSTPAREVAVTQSPVEVRDSYVVAIQKQNEISMKIARHQEKAELPKKEIKVFDGKDITEYRHFIQNFSRTIDEKCDNPADCLYYLEQFTDGVAKQLVKSCGHRDPTEAYSRALKLLEDEFGNEYRTANAYLQKLSAWPIIKTDDYCGLRDLSIFLLTCSNNMDSMGILNQLNSPKEIMEIVMKLPFEVRKKWRGKTLKIVQDSQTVAFKDLVKFVRNESELVNQPLFGNIRDSITTKSPHSPYKRKTLVTRLENENDMAGGKNVNLSCGYCKKNNHDISYCLFFKKLSYGEKKQYLKNNGYCYSCIKKGHVAKQCKQRASCKKCTRQHPTILHRDDWTTNETERRPENETETAVSDTRTEGHTNCATRLPGEETGAGGKVMCSIIPINIKIAGIDKVAQIYAALDTCSDACFIDSSLLSTLGVSGQPVRLQLKTVDGENKNTNTRVINNVECYDLDGVLHDTIPVVYAQSSWPFTHDDSPSPNEVTAQYLSELPFRFINSDVRMIIGMNRSELLKPLEVIDGAVGSAYATRHKLGWALCGPVGKISTENFKNCRVSSQKMNDIETKIEQMYDTDYKDSHLMKTEMSENNRKWEEIMKNTVKINDDNHFEISLPLKDGTSLPTNRGQIYRMFTILQRKFQTNPKLYDDYNEFMSMMIRNNFMELVPENELQNKSWYIPHHAVYHKEKNKIRVVFNCSLRYCGTSLNDVLLQGPDLTNSLLGVLLRFRQEPIAIMGDIEKMFYMVNVDEKSRDYLRCFWFDQVGTNKVSEYRLTVHVFGATSSPSVANFALLQTIKCSDKHSDAAKHAVEKNFYVDDFLCSVDSETKAETLLMEVTELVSTGGFKLTKFVSNSSKIMNNLRCRNLSSDEKIMQIGSGIDNLALGLLWTVASDILKFKINVKSESLTRRGMLSTINGVFDPLGLCGPVIVPAKVIFQDSCRLRLDWDTELPDPLRSRWITWLSDIPLLQQFELARCCKPFPAARTELHFFSDGSEVAYGAIVYVRFISECGQIHCAPLLAKGRLTPLSSSTHRTIPRTELNGAKISIILKQILDDELQYNIDAEYYWTDSTTVLFYLRNEEKRFVRFVANRVRLIKNTTDVQSWRYVPGSLNPADCLSRGCTMSLFLSNNLWTHGPEFLWKSEEFWPIDNEPAPPTDLEVVKNSKYCIASLMENSQSPIEKILQSTSSWFKAKQRVAWLLRYKNFLLHKNGKIGKLDVNDINEAEKTIIKHVQKITSPRL